MQYKPKDFKVGERVEAHPATDLFMRGIRYGNVAAIGRKKVKVQFDHWPHSLITVDPFNLLPVE